MARKNTRIGQPEHPGQVRQNRTGQNRIGRKGKAENLRNM
jgi:hypothetical protein